MNKLHVLTKTGKGARTLPNCDQLLSPNECRILSLVNGKFTIEDLQTRLTNLSNQEFHKAIAFLIAEGHVRQLSDDNDALDGPPSILGVSELDAENGVKAWAAATRAAEALKQNGYFLAQQDQSSNTGPQQILVIDDEQSIGQIVSVVLSSADYAVEWIDDPRHALEKILSMPNLCLVLLDVMMPQKNGFDVLREIRTQANLHRLAVVMLTAHANPEYVAEGLRDGADGYILKPFRPESLIRYIQDTLKSRQQ